MIDNHKLKTLDPKIRIHNYDEVVLGFNEDEAIEEASRCLNCINHPCVDGCPIHNRIPEFIQEIKNKNYFEAYKIISSKSSFPSICSRVCNSDAQCKSKCTRGIKDDPICINGLERFVCDQNINLEINKQENKNKKVGIIGAGPSGLAAAKDLAILGYDVTVYDSFNEPGGILAYGIPKFRLPKNVLNKEIEKVINLGVKIITNSKIENILNLKDKYDALYVAIGTGASKFMGIKGEGLKGVFSASEFLEKAKFSNEKLSLYIRNKNIAVIGGGNVAMDVARSAIRMDAKSVNIIYRRSINEIPASKEELEETIQEGVNTNFLTNPIEIIGKDYVEGIKCIKMELGKPDESGRRSPVEIQGSEFNMNMDVVVMAISTYPEEYIKSQNIELNKWNYIVVDENGKTNIDGVYAGGDIVSGPSTVVNAVKAGKLVATSIDKYLNK